MNGVTPGLAAGTLVIGVRITGPFVRRNLRPGSWGRFGCHSLYPPVEVVRRPRSMRVVPVLVEKAIRAPSARERTARTILGARPERLPALGARHLVGRSAGWLALPGKDGPEKVGVGVGHFLASPARRWSSVATSRSFGTSIPCGVAASQ